MASSSEIPTINVPPTKMLRSPSHESVTTELSLLSVSTVASDFTRLPLRGPSPRPHRAIPEILLEEEGDIIRSCGALSTALGLNKSFSTSDIARLGMNVTNGSELRHSMSEVALIELPPGRLDHTSRSCSTWVAVGDVTSTSQLPSPQGRPGSSNARPDSAAFTAADLIRSVNKKVRQHYLRRRLVSTYKALERLSQSDFNLERLVSVSRPLLQVFRPQQVDTNAVSLTVKDVERDRGKPLSRYERNMMIFNWLQNLDESGLPTSLDQ